MCEASSPFAHEFQQERLRGLKADFVLPEGFVDPKSYQELGSGLLENDSPFEIVAMEKEAQTSFMHKG